MAEMMWTCFLYTQQRECVQERDVGNSPHNEGIALYQELVLVELHFRIVKDEA